MTEFDATWEVLSKNTYRLAVPGGWIVKSVHVEIWQGCSVSVHQVFIADEHHGWTLRTPEPERAAL